MAQQVTIRTLLSALLLPLGAVLAQRADGDSWVDTAHHKPGFVAVAPGVRLHYLDFGGTGQPLVLLAGLGNTAHAYDDFAPALTDRFHVIALTRRGFGESSHPDSGYDTPRLVKDILAAMDRLHLGRVVLIGHSIAGEEMTLLAGEHPDRVSKLVYLDAAYDRIVSDSVLDEAFPVALDIPERPQPGAADTATADAYVAFVHRTRGVNIPDADIRARYRYDGWNEEITRAYNAIEVDHPNYHAVRAPALAIYAVSDTVTQLEPWQRTDREHAAALQQLIRGTERAERPSRLQFKTEMKHGGVLEIHGGHHWIFVSHRDEVLGAIRRFLEVK
jgi:pimeloyl-ACP methyl ester carboxylesterase